jgi:hypothetical protein
VGHGTGKIAGMVFVADDLGAWLVGLLADATLKKLTTLVLGSDQERALRQAAKAAVKRTAEQLAPSGDEQGQQVGAVACDLSQFRCSGGLLRLGQAAPPGMPPGGTVKRGSPQPVRARSGRSRAI